jgi:hypothetical protein
MGRAGLYVPDLPGSVEPRADGCRSCPSGHRDKGGTAPRHYAEAAGWRLPSSAEPNNLKWALLALGLLIGIGSLSAGLVATGDLSPVSNPVTNQTVYLNFQGAKHGYVMPGQAAIYQIGKYGIYLGAAVSFYGAMLFRKSARGT